MARLIVSALALALAIACSKKSDAPAEEGPHGEGDPCVTEGERRCSPEKSAVVRCADKRWRVSEACLGPESCAGRGSALSCDTSVATEGAACASAGDHTCTENRLTMLRCSGSVWKVSDKCLGERGCAAKGHDVTCDATLSELGAPCSHDHDQACAADGKALLRCTRGKMEAVLPCRGASACKVREHGRVECNQTLAEPDDACDTEGERACAVDQSAELVCVQGKFQKKKACAKCKVVLHNIECD